MDGLKHFKAQAIIFDKDGTLIDFDAMWGGWVVYLAEQLHLVSGLAVREPLCLAMGYDDANKKVLAHGKLAATPMSQLYRLTVEVMQSLGRTPEQAERAVEQGWCIPDPVVLAKQFTDTWTLFDHGLCGGAVIGSGDPDLDVLFVTSIQPAVCCGNDKALSGAVFALNVGVCGLPEPVFSRFPIPTLPISVPVPVNSNLLKETS